MKVYIGKSKIHGNGILAKAPIKRGEIVGVIKGSRKHYLIKNKNDSRAYPNWIGCAQNIWIDTLDPFSHINHSCDPNSGIRGMVTVRALRNIKKDEEVTIDYSTTEVDHLWSMKCNCGAKNCRRVLRSIEFLPKKVFNKYVPYVPTSFQKFYRKKHKQGFAN